MTYQAILSMTQPVLDGVAHGVCRPKKRWKNLLKNAVGSGQLKTVIQVTSLQVRRTVSPSLFLPPVGVTGLRQAMLVRSASAGAPRPTRAMQRGPLACALILLAITCIGSAVTAVILFAQFQTEIHTIDLIHLINFSVALKPRSQHLASGESIPF